MDESLSYYLKNSMFEERENNWPDESSIYPQTHTIGCFPLNLMLPNDIASSRFANLGIPLGLIQYNTRPVGYVTKYITIQNSDSKNQKKYKGGDDEDDYDECDDGDDCKNTITGGGIDFDKLVGNVLHESSTGGSQNTHHKTRKIRTK